MGAAAATPGQRRWTGDFTHCRRSVPSRNLVKANDGSASASDFSLVWFAGDRLLQNTPPGREPGRDQSQKSIISQFDNRDGLSASRAIVSLGDKRGSSPKRREACRLLAPNCGGLGHLHHFAQRFYLSQALDQDCQVSRGLSCLHSCSSGSARSLVHFTLFKAASASSPTQPVL